MGGPSAPPVPDWDLISGSPVEFDTAKSLAKEYGYDSQNQSFRDASGTPYYLYLGPSRTSTGHVAWYCCTDADSNKSPQGKIPSLTFDVIKDGSINTSTGTISYNGKTYVIDLRRQNGVQVAYAKEV